MAQQPTTTQKPNTNTNIKIENLTELIQKFETVSDNTNFYKIGLDDNEKNSLINFLRTISQEQITKADGSISELNKKEGEEKVLGNIKNIARASLFNKKQYLLLLNFILNYMDNINSIIGTLQTNISQELRKHSNASKTLQDELTKITDAYKVKIDEVNKVTDNMTKLTTSANSIKTALTALHTISKPKQGGRAKSCGTRNCNNKRGGFIKSASVMPQNFYEL